MYPFLYTLHVCHFSLDPSRSSQVPSTNFLCQSALYILQLLLTILALSCALFDVSFLRLFALSMAPKRLYWNRRPIFLFFNKLCFCGCTCCCCCGSRCCGSCCCGSFCCKLFLVKVLFVILHTICKSFVWNARVESRQLIALLRCEGEVRRIEANWKAQRELMRSARRAQREWWATTECSVKKYNGKWARADGSERSNGRGRGSGSGERGREGRESRAERQSAAKQQPVSQAGNNNNSKGQQRRRRRQRRRQRYKFHLRAANVDVHATLTLLLPLPQHLPLAHCTVLSTTHTHTHTQT